MKEYAAGIQSSALSLVDAPATSRDEAPSTDAESPAGSDSERAPPAASENRFLAEATKEHASGHVDPSFWARAVTQARGDEALAMRIYLDSRATALRVAERQEKAARRERLEKALSNAPAPGVDAKAPEGRDETTSKEPSRTRPRSARPNRKRLILVAGGLGSVVVIAGLVALWSQSGDTEQQYAAKPAPPVSASGRSKLSGSVAAKAGGPVRQEVSSEDFAGKVQALENAGNWNVLVIYALDWTRKHPGNTDAWKRLSLGYVKLGQLPEALDAATKAVQLAPEDFLLWQSLGQVNLAFQRRPEALLAFQRAAALNDRDVVSLVQQGVLNSQLGHIPDAKIAFAKALAVSPEDVQALCGAASIAQKEGRVKDADAMARQVTSLDGRCRDSSGSESVRVVTSGPPQSRSASTSGR